MLDNLKPTTIKDWGWVNYFGFFFLILGSILLFTSLGSAYTASHMTTPTTPPYNAQPQVINYTELSETQQKEFKQLHTSTVPSNTNLSLPLSEAPQTSQDIVIAYNGDRYAIQKQISYIKSPIWFGFGGGITILSAFSICYSWFARNSLRLQQLEENPLDFIEK